MCDMLDAYTEHVQLLAKNTSASVVCEPTKSGPETYINSIIIGCVTVLPYSVFGILANRVSKKLLLIACALDNVGVILGIRWATTKSAIVTLFAISAAITHLSLSLMQALTVQIFPTTTRTLAVSLMMLCGRVGTLVGNIMFPVLLNMGCVVPFYTMTAMMICVTIMCMYIPKTEQR